LNTKEDTLKNMGSFWFMGSYSFWFG